MMNSVYAKYKANRLWDVDFRTGSYQDRSNNVVFIKTGSLTKNGFEMKPLTYLSTILDVTFSEFTLILKVDLRNQTLEAAEIFTDRSMIVYLIGNLLYVSFAPIPNSLVVFGEVHNKISTIAITAKDGVLNHYLNGVFVASRAYVQSDFTIVNQLIHTNEPDRYFNGTYHYNIMYDKALTATEIAQLTDELDKEPKTAVSSKTTLNTLATVFNGTSTFYTVSPTIDLSYDKDFKFGFWWKCKNPIGTEKVLLGSTSNIYAYFIRQTTSSDLQFYNGTALSSLAFSSDWINNMEYYVEVEYAASTGLITAYRKLKSGAREATTTSNNLKTLWGATWALSFDLIGKRGNNDRHWQGNIYDFCYWENGVVKLEAFKGSISSDRKNNYTIDPTGITPAVIVTTDVNFKGEMAVIANETTISSGFLENSGAQILSGSAKIITERNSANLEKVVECVTNCRLDKVVKSDGDYHCYIKPNGTPDYVEHVSGIDSAYSVNLAVDGDMELAGVANWPVLTACTVTKEASTLPGSTQCLRLTYNGTVNPQVQQTTTFITGKRYKITGYARGDGTVAPRVLSGDAALTWSGTSSASWQPVLIEGVAGVALNLVLRATTGVAGYAEFDNILVQEVGILANMATGDKVILASDDPNRSLRQKN